MKFIELKHGETNTILHQGVYRRRGQKYDELDICSNV